MTKETVEFSNVWAKYKFSTDEMADIAKTLALKTQELDELEDEKKAINSTFKDRIEACQLEVKTSARKYKDGYEMRDIECEVQRDYEAGEIIFIRTDTGEIAQRKKMTSAERQMTVMDAIDEAIQ